MVPELVIGPPDAVRPVVPPLTSTLVTVPSGLADHWNADPLHSRNVFAEVGAATKLELPLPVWYTN